MSIFFYHVSLSILPLFFVLSFARPSASKIATSISIAFGILCGFICFGAFMRTASIDEARIFFDIFTIILLLALPLTYALKYEYFILGLFFLLSLVYGFAYRVISMNFGIFAGDLLDSLSLTNLFMVCFGFIVSVLIYLLMRGILVRVSKVSKISFFILTLLILIADRIGFLLLSLMQNGTIPTYTKLLSYTAKLIYASEFLPIALSIIGFVLACIALKNMPLLAKYEQIIAFRQSKAARAKAFNQLGFSVFLGAVISGVALFYILVASKPPKISDPIIVEPVNGEFVFDAKMLLDNELHRYAYITDDGHKVRFFMLNRFPDKLAPVAVYDSCAICGDMGYIKKGEDLICISCNVRIFLPSVGKPGGCNPLPFDYTYDGKNIRIALSTIEKGASFFSEVVEKIVTDPVSRKQISNSSKYSYLYYGRTYFFENEQNQAAFEANASKYTDTNGILKELK